MNATAIVYDTTLETLIGDELIALPATEEGEAEEKEETVNPVLPTGSDIVYAAIFFFALWAAMKFVLLPPIQKVRAERAQKIAAAKDAADSASSDMGTAQADYDAALAGARAEAQAIIDAARADADAHRATVMAAAEHEVAQLRADAERELAEARSTALGSLTDDVAGIAAGAASAVVGRELDVATARPIVERALSGGRS